MFDEQEVSENPILKNSIVYNDEDNEEEYTAAEDLELNNTNYSKSIRISEGESIRRSSCGIQTSFTDVKEKIENHFIDVGSLTFGGIFGLGEKFEHRVIMARTTVQCLMIPRYWLLEQEQNPGNIWQRRRFYLDTTIPSRETLFKDFLNTRQWHNFKMNIIQSHLNKNSIANPTHVEDIPIICRIVEARDE